MERMSLSDREAGDFPLVVGNRAELVGFNEFCRRVFNKTNVELSSR
jgi:hypothetical protein